MTLKHPSLTWLIKNDPDAALAVFHRLRDEYYAYGEDRDPRYVAANQDDVQTHAIPETLYSSGTLSEVPDVDDDIHPEMLHEWKPGMHEMLRSAGGTAWPWAGVRVRHDGKLKWIGAPWAYEFPTRQATRTGPHMCQLGGLTYYTKPNARRGAEGGLLTSYVSASGKVEKPQVTAKKPKGGKRPHRVDPQGYLNLPAAFPSPLTALTLLRPMSGEPALGDFFDPLPGVAETRATLRQFGVDGSVAFDALPFPATKLPDVVAKGARFIAGITGRCQTAGVAAPHWKEAEVKPLGPVLEEVAARGTLKSIGIRMGYRGGYADRAGKRLLLAAGRELVAANQNNLKKTAA